MAEPKTQANDGDVDAFLDSVQNKSKAEDAACRPDKKRAFFIRSAKISSTTEVIKQMRMEKQQKMFSIETAKIS